MKREKAYKKHTTENTTHCSTVGGGGGGDFLFFCFFTKTSNVVTAFFCRCCAHISEMEHSTVYEVEFLWKFPINLQHEERKKAYKFTTQNTTHSDTAGVVDGGGGEGECYQTSWCCDDLLLQVLRSHLRARAHVLQPGKPRVQPAPGTSGSGCGHRRIRGCWWVGAADSASLWTLVFHLWTVSRGSLTGISFVNSLQRQLVFHL